jgi:hypothetical protein
MPPAHRLPDPVRFYLYVTAAMLGAAWLVIVENADLHWGWIAAYSAWQVGVNLLAASNTTNRTDFAAQAALQRDLDIANRVGRFGDLEG